jgi:L-lactate dehydrogenase
MHKPTVFVIGAGGMVGATVAHTLAVKEIVNDIALIDIAEEVVRGQATDISHTTAYTSGVHVRVGDYNEIADDDIIVITCGQNQTATHKGIGTRLDLLSVNIRIISAVIGKIREQGKNVFIVMVSNPVDVLTYIAQKESGLPKERVLGSGTALDTARLRVALAERLHVSQQGVIAYVLGEHGNSSFAALSHATISGIPLRDFPGFRQEWTTTITQDIRDSAYQIIAAKKATYYGIGQTVAQIVDALTKKRGVVMPVSAIVGGEYGLSDIAIGLPSLVSSSGVRIVDGYPLSENERSQLIASAKIVSMAVKEAESLIPDPGTL